VTAFPHADGLTIVGVKRGIKGGNSESGRELRRA